MRIKKCTTAFTLIEMLVVVSIIAVLVTIVISVATRLDTQGKISSTQGTFALVNTALSEFQDYGFTYASGSQYANAHLKFPIDCNGFSETNFENALGNAINKSVSIDILPSYDPNFSGTIAMYFLLSEVPQCRQTLEKIDSKFVVRNDRLSRGDRLGQISVTDAAGTFDYPSIYVADAWGRPLGYKYYYFTSGTNIDTDTIKTFPVITSAGPDGRFGTGDDIKSR